MAKRDRILERILQGTSDANIPFNALCQILSSLGFDERIRGSHHIFTKDDVIEIINIQPKGSKSKAYQVKQVRDIILKYKMLGDD
ncbi:MAG: type II toxin-antitoxin system HicA family toxin [Anaerolineales bacterium]|nr:type II toxin-antitoxin system HicA family toxin [Chloroflexota bacterium]MBL7161741.1 type II toxin-antitoxin system HicA family toxin [Anaerolineales bacterium]